MICIECTEPVWSLYTQYSTSNIRLTACPRCNKFADKYIEYDNVLIFVDILLLKPQAYRHLVFNVFTPEVQQWGAPPSFSAHEAKAKENAGLQDGTTNDDSVTTLSATGRQTFEDQTLRKRKEKSSQHISAVAAAAAETNKATLSDSATSVDKSSGRIIGLVSAFLRFPIISGLHTQAQRMWLLVTLFDVYLTWVRAEQNRSVDSKFNAVLEFPVLAQYSTFFVLCVVESLCTHFTLRLLAIHWLGWQGPGNADSVRADSTNNNSTGNVSEDGEKSARESTRLTQTISPSVAKAALSTALLISSSSKLFPILMVIWSYDVPFAATVLGWAISFNTVEVLIIILQCGYVKAVLMTAVAALVRIGICDHAALYLLQKFWKYVLMDMS